MTEVLSALEFTHRSRSFLFAALGAAVASMFGLERISFFENGVVSINFPPVGQVVGARATRTTHPRVLAGFARLAAAISGKPLAVENPFIWQTKAEVIERIASAGCGDLIRHTRSCTRVREITKLHTHCGRCSQCIDRRFGVLRAAKAADDPEEAYEVDLFAGEREAGPDREMALSYVRNASRIDKIDEIGFFARFPEASRIVDCFDEPSDTVARRVLDLHRRHARGVCEVFDAATRDHAPLLREGSIPPTSLLRLVIGDADERHEGLPRPPEPLTSLPVLAEVRLAIDPTRDRVVLDGWGQIVGAGASLLIALADPFREDREAERSPEQFRFTTPQSLMKRFQTDEESLRKRVFRCRQDIAKLVKKASGMIVELDAVIENLPWHGYRLNPDRVRLVALAEIHRAPEESGKATGAPDRDRTARRRRRKAG